MSQIQSSRNAAAFNSQDDDVFARIASRYDRLCDIFSVFAHRLWKNKMAHMVANLPGEVALDVASGTGDIPFRAIRYLNKNPKAEHKKRLIVSDLCPEMLHIAREKLDPQKADLSYRILDFHDLAEIESESVDIYSISFAMKICDRDRVLSEAYRVLKPGGVFLCLEASTIPVRWIHRLYLKYMDFCLPLIARIATRGDAGAYNYFLKGIHEHPSQKQFIQEMNNYGFQDVSFQNLSLGIVALHQGVKV